MPLFISEDELERLSDDGRTVAEKADAFIKGLHLQLETVKAEADAASITAEQTCSLLEQKYVSVSSEYASLQTKYSDLNSCLQQRDSELAQLQADKHQIHLQSIAKDEEVERLTLEGSELHKSKRELMELLERKDLEIKEKNSNIAAFLDKIVKLTDAAAQKDSRLSELESELARCQASCARLSQEKELLQRHNTWLNDELTSKVDSMIELRRKHGELETEMSTKLADVEDKFNESSSSLKWHKERMKELDSKLTSLEEELLSSKDSASAMEEHYRVEISTVSKLVDLYKESSEEWSRKAGELEGVIKALETHSSQVENDYKERLDKEESVRREVEKEAASLTEKLSKCEAELERTRKENELKTLPLSFTTELGLGGVRDRETVANDGSLVPSFPASISGTALAASLLRDGWSLAKMYAKYQEAIDAFRHEQLGRKQTQAVLERVLYEVEEKAGIILDERAEHEKLVEAYSLLNEKLQNSFSEQTTLERTIQELKADLRRRERDYTVAQSEITDLQKQVTVLLKECRDVQFRCGSSGPECRDDRTSGGELDADMDPENIITSQLLTFKDINGLVEQNVRLRCLVRSLSSEIEMKETELKETYENQLRKHNEEAVVKVNAVLARAEEQARMIESLHTSVAMYRKLYEEEHKLRSAYSKPQDPPADGGRKDIVLLLEDSHEALRKREQEAIERMKCLEEEVAKLRSEIISVRSERDKLAHEARCAQDKLSRSMKEYEHERERHYDVRARNVELSQLILDYQRKVRESSESLAAAEERSRKLSVEVDVLKNEKQILVNAEKRASDEVRNLSERVHRLQATLDTIQSTEEVREEARITERRKQDEYVKQIEREWAEAKKELQVERENVRNLTIERENTMKNALKQVEEMGKELANASRATAAAETRAAVAEARCADFEKNRLSGNKMLGKDGETGASSVDEASLDLRTIKEVERLRVEAEANKDHMLQYKSIAEVNEAALKQMESAHENYKVEMEEAKKLLEDELQSLRERVKELENECHLMMREVASTAAGKEEALAAAFSEISSLKEEGSIKSSQIATMDIQISALKEDLEKEHLKWRSAQANYERQVILQSETIQELTKTSQGLASLQEEASALRKLVDTLKSENNELKAKWEVEKSVLEVSKNEADRRYNEVNELNKVLHSQLEAFHIRSAEKDRLSAGLPSGSTRKSDSEDEGLQNVVNYLRRSKEIAETEIALLKQEKLRLQSQLESALKAAESAQASLHAERTNARSLLFTEEEFKSLQLQVRELNLLRESNAQLREENRHNFEECQKLRDGAHKTKIDAENLEKLLSERHHDLECCKNEIEMQKMEKDHLQKTIDELRDIYKNLDMEEYHRTKEAVQKMQVNLSEKDAQLEEVRKLVSEKQDVISHLEQNLERSKTELKERETRINELLQIEASQKSEIEKYRRLSAQWKKKSDNVSKEREDLNKEIQSLTKQLEDSRQGKRNLVDTGSEQATREQEKEKETRIQMLVRTVERTREELKRERDDNKIEKARQLQTQKTISERYETVIQERSKLLDELEKHKQSLKALTEEVDRLKNAVGSQAEGASVELPPVTLLEDLAGAYLGAVENFGRVAQQISNELGTQPAAEAGLVTSFSEATAGQAVVSLAPSTVSSTATSVPSVPAGNAEEKDKSSSAPKTNIDARKAARKLVRPRILKPEEPQTDVEMTDVDGSANSGKPPEPNLESQGNVASTMPPAAHKRPSSSASEIQEELPAPEETSSDVTAPLAKRVKVSETPPEVEEQEVTNVDMNESVSAPEEPLDDVSVPHGSKEESFDEADKDEAEIPGNPLEESTLPGKNQDEFLGDKTDDSSIPGGQNEAIASDDQQKAHAEPDSQQAIGSGGEFEDGELIADEANLDGGIAMESQEIGELPHDHATNSPSSPGVDQEQVIPSTVCMKKVDSSQLLDHPKNGDAVPTEKLGTDKTSDISEPVTAEPGEIIEPPTSTPDRTPTSAAVEPGASGRRPSPVPDTEGRRQVSPAAGGGGGGGGGRTINLNERARERASIRQAAMLSSSTTRGRARVLRGRGRSAAPRGRGQGSEQG